MSYQGFGYSPYQYLPSGQNAQPSSYSTLRQIPVTSASATPNIQQTADRSYGQQAYEWQGQNTTDISSQSAQQPQTESWQPSNNRSHSYGHQHQQQSSYHTSNTMPSISSQQTQQSHQTHNERVSPTVKKIQYGSSALEPIPMHYSTADSHSNTSASTNMSYRTDSRFQNRSPANVALPIEDPTSAQHSRSTAASTMTALSSSIPPPRATSQRLPTSQADSFSTSHSHTSNYGTPLSNLVSSNPTTRPSDSAHTEQSYHQQSAKQQYNRMSTASAQSNLSRNQQPVFQTRDPYSSSVSGTPTPSSIYPDPSSSSQRHRTTGYINTDTSQQPPAASHAKNAVSDSSSMNFPPEDQAANTSQSQPYQPATPSFIDPSQIYNPYYQEYQKKKAAEANVETERMKHKEIENQKEIERQKVAGRQEEVEREEMVKEKQIRGTQNEIRQKIAAANKFAARVRADKLQAESLTAVNYSTPLRKAKPGRKTGPKLKMQDPNPTDSPHGQPQISSRKQRQPLKPPVETPASATPAEMSGSIPQAPLAPTGPSSGDQSQAPTAAAQTPTKGQSDEDEDLEMKLMFEKIKELKSKAPSKFAKLIGGLEVPVPVTAPPQVIEDQRTTTVLTPVTSTPANPTYECNSVNDRGKFPAARRKRKSKAADMINDGAHFSPTQHDAQPPTPATPSLQEADKNDRPAQMSGSMKIDKLIDSDKPQPPPLPAPVQAATSPVRPGPEQTKEVPPKTATIWPEPKRLTLAQAASRYIDDVLANKNKGKKCPPEIVLSLIDQNPSYIELCAMLESRDYVLNRVHFAKHLLKAVPELTGGSSSAARPNPPANRPSSTPNQEQTQPPPATEPLRPPTQYMSSYAAVPRRNISESICTPSTAPPGPGVPALGDQTGKPATPSASMTPPINVTPNVTPRYIGSYQLPISIPPENRVPGFLGSSPPTPPTISKRKQPTGPAGPHSHHKTTPASRHRMGDSTPSPVGGKLNPKLRVPAPPAHVPAPGSKEALARKRTFAEIVDFTQLSSDDADSPPPPKAPRIDDVTSQGVTNMDLDIQGVPAPASETPEAPGAPTKMLDLSQFRMPDADLSTSNEALRKRTDIVKPLNKTEALKTRYYDPKTIARDLLIATGRHPTERPLNQHLLKLRDNFPAVENSSDLRTFRWDVVDPGGPPPPEVPLVSAVSRPPSITVRQYAKPPPGRLPNQPPCDPIKDANRTSVHASFPHTPSQLRNSQTVNNSDDLDVIPENHNNNSSVMSSTPPVSGARRRGRPPGAKNKPRLADRVEVAIPTSLSSKAAQTPYRTYKCEWKGCDAQLHNLQTLRKHVTRLHIVRDNSIGTPCLWAGCSGCQETFTSDKLADHLEKIHLSALAWTLGEGPGSVRSDHRNYNIDDYLNDSNGRAVIARATAKGTRPTLILPAAYRSIRSFNKMYGNESDKAKALEVMRALEMKQVRVGTGLGRGGCTFMNEKRQETVAAFESVFEIVPDDNDGL